MERVSAREEVRMTMAQSGTWEAGAGRSSDDVDLYDPDNYVDGVPHDVFRRLRAESPVHRVEPYGCRPFWAITRYRDVITVSRDPHTYSSYRGGSFLRDYDEDSQELTVLRLFLLHMDPPQHARYRNIVRHGFTPKVVQLLEDRIRRRVVYLLERAAERGECDFITDVAAELPLEVIAELIGIPEADRPMLFALSTRAVSTMEPNPNVEMASQLEEGQACAMQMLAYAGEMAQRRFAEEPRDDLISTLIHGAVDGALDAMEFAVFFILMIVAGFETTRNVIGSGTYRLLQQPEDYARLRADPALIPGAVEEMLRYDPPIVYFRRTVMCDTELRGQKLREGDKVALYYGSANRDEEIFADPDRFDITRTPNDHLAFGIGEHICLGNTLARLEIRTMFEEMTRRFSRIELAGRPERYRSSFINGLRIMPVRFTR
jgi:cholest-4-en-3-one 26-monooxygenase